MSIVAKRLNGSRYATCYEGRHPPKPNGVRWGPSSPRKGQSSPTFLPMSIAAGLDGSGCTEVCLGQATLHYRGLELPPTEKGHSSPHFSAL